MSHPKPIKVNLGTPLVVRRRLSRDTKWPRSIGPLPCSRSSRPLLILAGLLVPVLAATPGGPLPGPLPLLPADNWWNQDVSAAPLDPDSAAFINFIGPTKALHPDFGGEQSPGSTAIYGMPYIVVNAIQTKRAVAFDYADESDGVDHSTGLSYPFYPIPDEAIMQPHWIEGGYPGNENVGGDRHMLIVDSDNKYLYELFSVRYSGGQWFAGSGAFFDLKLNGRRPDGWTSADAAGLAILPGLVRYDEVYGTDEIRHAFRFTVRATNGYVWPASHRAGSTTGALPMGARLRLKASKDISAFDPFMQKIFRAMKKYGLIVADNGSDMFITGTFDTRWDNDILNPAFGALRADDFEVVELGWQPSPAPTPAFADVPFGHPYYDEIEWLYRNGYTSGCATNPLLYCPDATMNRAESAVFVERGVHSASYDPPAPTSQVFADLPLDSWAAGWVNGLWEDQYTAGCGTNPLMYCPWQGHTRAEGAVFYLRMLRGSAYEPPQPTEQTFADVPLGVWYARWVQAAYEAAIITACQTMPEMRFCPDDPLSRGLAAYMMYRAKLWTPPAPTTLPPTATPPPPTPSPTPPQPTPTTNPGNTVTIDMGAEQGPVTYRAAGYLGSDITDTLPNDSVFAAYWEPLKLQLFSWIRPRIEGKTGAVTFPGLARARALNAYYQVKIYHDPGDMSLGLESPWGQEVTRIAQAALATNYSKIQLDILNEPDYSGYWPGNINDPRILDAWRIAHDAARSVSPDLDLVGINVVSSYNWLKSTFLPTMKAENRLPDIVSWHEINTPKNQINSRIQDMRFFLSQNNMDVEDVSINEYNYTNSHLQPGYGVQFMAELEAGKVQSASRACWEEVAGGSYDCAPHINGFLTTTGQPRSIWHTYKAYADMTGTLVRLTPSQTTVGLASKDYATTRGYLLLGNIESPSPISVIVTNLQNSPFQDTGLPITITIHHITSSGQGAMAAPELIQQFTQTPQDGQVAFSISGVSLYDAYSIILSR